MLFSSDTDIEQREYVTQRFQDFSGFKKENLPVAIEHE